MKILLLLFIMFVRVPLYANWSEEYQELVEQLSIEKDIPVELIRAVIMAESSYNNSAISPKGARGFMQLMPETAEMLGVKDINCPFENIRGGVKYLRILLDRFSQNIPLALAAYNAGSSMVRRHGGIPPFPETRQFVFRVIEFYAIYKTESRERERRRRWIFF